MLAKMTSKNQITIPKKILEQLPATEYFEVSLREGAVVLNPVKAYGTDLKAIRAKMQSLGLDDTSVAEAVQWARNR